MVKVNSYARILFMVMKAIDSYKKHVKEKSYKKYFMNL